MSSPPLRAMINIRSGSVFNIAPEFNGDRNTIVNISIRLNHASQHPFPKADDFSRRQIKIPSIQITKQRTLLNVLGAKLSGVLTGTVPYHTYLTFSYYDFTLPTLAEAYLASIVYLAVGVYCLQCHCEWWDFVPSTSLQAAIDILQQQTGMPLLDCSLMGVTSMSPCGSHW